MHWGEGMELRNSKSQMPLSDNNPVLPGRKGLGFGFWFSTSRMLKWKRLVCWEGKEACEGIESGLAHSTSNKLCSLS